ncbi:MAG: glutathione S-transferase C-terminal domain-containing protein, partial [Reyranellaceae bacterium]
EDHPRRAELPARQAQGRAALGVMDGHLATHDFFAGGYSTADIALYAYTHRADEAGIDLAPFPAVRAWLARVAGQPGHVPMLP